METPQQGLIVVGAGHAGSELAIAARQAGWAGRIVLLGDEPCLPYQRPPLSKAYLLGETAAQALALRPEPAYQAADVELRLGARLASIDRAARIVTLADGTSMRYDKLALCTGGRPKALACDGIDVGQPPRNLLCLRTLADADRIRASLTARTRLVVVGGGYVGLEVAASARSLGADVTLLEAQPRVLARVAGPEISRFYERVHRDAGVHVRTGVVVERVDCHEGAISTLHCRDGIRVDADLVVAGIGMVPNVEAAAAAGLAGDRGIAVDECARTLDPHIVAAGDCTWQRHALYDQESRLESVPNALEQARAAASWLGGKPRPHRGVPWFWSDQYDLKLQTAGLSQGYDRCVLRGDPDRDAFCALYLRGDRLLAVDAVNRPADFMLVRRALARPVMIETGRLDALSDESVPLKSLLEPVSPLAAGKS